MRSSFLPEAEAETSNRTHTNTQNTLLHSLTHTCMHAIYCREGENRRTEQFSPKTNIKQVSEQNVKKTIIVSVLFEIQQFYINGNCIEKN